jgi:hypothetical protein
MYPDSIAIDYIDYEKLKFLTNRISNTIEPDDFDLKTGKPKNNIENNPKINPFFESIASNLSERNNIHKSFVFKYPNILDPNGPRDIQVGNETTIDIVFISEGASMLNMFGYYMYYIDEKGSKHILSNDKSPDSTYYYDPTVIYPYVYSYQDDPSTLQTGDTRRLRGNLPNGNFSNIYIGFFLVPHGWFAYLNKGPVDNKDILYSSTDFNCSYKESEYQMINDKIYSVYAKTIDKDKNELLFTAFEDILNPTTDDLDYNDCVVGFIISDVSNIVDYDKYCKVKLKESNHNVMPNNIVRYDEGGEYVHLDKEKYKIKETNSHCFERHMCFDNKKERDHMYDVLKLLSVNYKDNLYKTEKDDKYMCRKIFI